MSVATFVLKLVDFTVSTASKMGWISCLFKKFMRLFFKFRCTPYTTYRPRRMQRSLNKATAFIEEWEGSKLSSLKNMLLTFINKVQNLLDNIDYWKNPFRHLFLDKFSAESMNVILEYCTLPHPFPFWFAIPFWKRGIIEKIGEGTYGQVYRAVYSNGSLRIIKLLPVHGRHPDSEIENLSSLEVVADIVSSQHLSDLRHGRCLNNKASNFPSLLNAFVIKGKFPDALLNAWAIYYVKALGIQRSPRPERYDKSQLFLMLEYDECGTDLMSNDHFLIDNVVVCAVAVCQIVAALSAAEMEFAFEHRDLHIDNVLLKPSDETSLKYVINGQHYSIKTCGYVAYIIDYSMARIAVKGNIYLMPSMSNRNHGYPDDGREFWEEHHYVYDKQREICGENWAEFHPFTNLLWVKHIITVMLQMLDSNTKVSRRILSRDQKTALQALQSWERDILDYCSATHFFTAFVAAAEPYVTAE